MTENGTMQYSIDGSASVFYDGKWKKLADKKPSEILVQHIYEQEMIEKYPSIKKAYESYQILLGIYSE